MVRQQVWEDELAAEKWREQIWQGSVLFPDPESWFRRIDKAIPFEEGMSLVAWIEEAKIKGIIDDYQRYCLLYFVPSMHRL